MVGAIPLAWRNISLPLYQEFIMKITHLFSIMSLAQKTLIL